MAPIPVRASAAGTAAGWLERGAFLLLLLIVAMRPLLAEVYEQSAGLLDDVTYDVQVATPATTAGFDTAVWLAGLAVTAAALLRRRAWRWTGLELGLLLMLVAAVVSTYAAASNQRLALNASIDWLTAGVLWILLANLCRDRSRIVLVLAVVLASGLTAGAVSIMQVTVDFERTRQEYEQNKAQLWASKGIQPGDPSIELFERRMRANEATGFFAHSNAAGSLFLIAGFAGLSVAGLTASRPVRLAVGLAAAGAFLGILLTGSRGALFSAPAGLLLLAAACALRSRLRRSWRLVLPAGGAAVAGLAALIMLVGRLRGGLPGSSLSFRWNYWEVSGRIIREHLWTGLGALNFDWAYLAHKPIDYPEEIKDPHNFAISILAQWGLPGLVGLLLAMGGAAWVAWRRWAELDARSTSARPDTAAVGPPSNESAVRTLLTRRLAVVVGGFVLLRIWLLSPLLGTSSGQAFVLFDLGLYGLVWAVSFTATGWLVLARPSGVRGDSRMAVMAGLAAFLLHNTIDYSLLLPGTLTVFAAMGAVAVAVWNGTVSSQDGAGPPAGDSATARRAAIVPAAGMAVAVIGALVTLALGYVPVSRCGEWLARARQAQMPAAGDIYLQTAAMDPFDAAPLAELADRFLREPSMENVDVVLTAVHEAIGRDPRRIAHYRLLAQLYELRFQASRSESDLWAAIGAAGKVVDLYPQSPDDHLGLAALLARAAHATDSPEWFAQARAEFTSALELDAARPGTDEVRKWTPSRRSQVEGLLRDLPPPASQTAPAAEATRPG